MNKIRAIVKRPNELIGHELSINNALKTFQNIVGGYIEVVPIGGSGSDCWRAAWCAVQIQFGF